MDPADPPISPAPHDGPRDGPGVDESRSTLVASDEAGRDAARLALVERFFAGTGSTYDTMVRFATLGIDGLWKKRMLARIPPGAGPVLDLACGTGISTMSIARRFPGRHIVGVELRDEYLSIACAKAKREALDNVEFVLCRAEDFDSALCFDCITSSYLAKYGDLCRLTRNARAMLRPGGLLMMHDFTLPPSRPLVLLWRAYFAVMRSTVPRLVPEWKAIYEELPRLIERTRWVDELREALANNGFVDVRVDPLTLHGSAIVTAIRR